MAGEIANPLSGLIDGLLTGHNLGLQLRKQQMDEQAFKTNQALHEQQMSVQDIMNRQMLQENARPVSDMGTTATPAMTAPSGIQGLPGQQVPSVQVKADPSRTVKYGGRQYELKTPEEQQQGAINQEVNKQSALELAKGEQAQRVRQSVLTMRGVPVPDDIATALRLPPGSKVLPEEIPGLAEHVATMNKPQEVTQGGSLVNPTTGKVVFQGQPKLNDQEAYVEAAAQAIGKTTKDLTGTEKLKFITDFKHDPEVLAREQRWHDESVGIQKQAAARQEQAHQDSLDNQNRAALDRESALHSKSFEEISKGADAQLDKILDAEKMLSGGAVQQALGIPKILTALVSGNGAGVRITKSEMDSIAKARGLSGDIEGWFNKMTGQGSMTTQQKAQAQSILNDVRERIVQKKAAARQASDEIMNAPDRKGVLDAVKRGRDALDAQQGGGPKVGDTKSYGGRNYTFDGKEWVAK